MRAPLRLGVPLAADAPHFVLVGLLVADAWPFEAWAMQSDLSDASVESFATVFAC